MEILYAQFNLNLLSNGFSISETEKMNLDEFFLFLNMLKEKQKELESQMR